MENRIDIVLLSVPRVFNLLIRHNIMNIGSVPGWADLLSGPMTSRQSDSLRHQGPDMRTPGPAAESHLLIFCMREQSEAA